MNKTVQKPRLLDQVRAKIRAKAYSLKTEKAYVYWIRKYILFHNMRNPGDADRRFRFMSIGDSD